MAVPKRKTSKAKGRTRRTHQKTLPPTTLNCPECGEAKLPHNVCLSCGKYKGQTVLKIKDTDS